MPLFSVLAFASSGSNQKKMPETINSHHKATFLIPLFFLGVSGVVGAQEVEQSDLELCASMETAELKLACFEALTAIGGRDDPVVQQSGERESLPAQEVRVPDPTGTALPPKAVVDTASASSPPVALTEQSQEVVPATPEAERYKDLGSEQLEKTRQQADEEDQPITLTVTEVSEGRYDILYFHMANGQVWRQVEGRRFRYPKNQPFDVLITQGVMGEYRLRLSENDPMTRIRRVK